MAAVGGGMTTNDEEQAALYNAPGRPTALDDDSAADLPFHQANNSYKGFAHGATPVKEDIETGGRPVSGSDDSCCGCRRKTAYIITGVAVVLVILLGAGLGAGLGIGLKKKSSPSPPPPLPMHPPLSPINAPPAQPPPAPARMFECTVDVNCSSIRGICDRGMCSRTLADGFTCSTDEACSSGTCAMVSGIGYNGTVCLSRIGQFCIADDGCLSGLTCQYLSNGGNPNVKYCLPASRSLPAAYEVGASVPVDGQCAVDAECDVGYCIENTCTNKFAEDVRCKEDSECVSNACALVAQFGWNYKRCLRNNGRICGNPLQCTGGGCSNGGSGVGYCF